jgi:hypothetical protein
MLYRRQGVTVLSQRWTVPTSYTRACPHCAARNDGSNEFCQQCSLPLRSDEFDLLHAPALHEGRKWMGGVAILYALGGVLQCALEWSHSREDAVGSLVIMFVLALIQGGLWVWSKRATFAAAVASMALYVTLILLGAVIDPASLASGWLIKVMFILALSKAIKAGLVVRRLKLEAQARAAATMRAA